MAGVWSLDGDDVQKDLDAFRSGEMRVALLARRDEVNALRRELDTATRLRDGAVRAAATADRAFEEVRMRFALGKAQRVYWSGIVSWQSYLWSSFPRHWWL